MPDEIQTTSEEDADFCRLLEQIKAGQQKTEALLEHPVFKRKVPSICHALTFNHADAEDLANRVRFRVFNKFGQFEPEHDKRYWNFFAWVRRIAQRLAISDSRRKSFEYSDIRSDEMVAVEDAKNSVAVDLDVDLALQRYLAFVAALDPRDQKILEIWRDGYFQEEDGFSLREIQEKLAEHGIECSHVTVQKVVRKVNEAFIMSEVSRKGPQTSGRRKKTDPSSKGDDIPFIRQTGS